MSSTRRVSILFEAMQRNTRIMNRVREFVGPEQTSAVATQQSPTPSTTPAASSSIPFSEEDKKPKQATQQPNLTLEQAKKRAALGEELYIFVNNIILKTRLRPHDKQFKEDDEAMAELLANRFDLSHPIIAMKAKFNSYDLSTDLIQEARILCDALKAHYLSFKKNPQNNPQLVERLKKLAENVAVFSSQLDQEYISRKQKEPSVKVIAQYDKAYHAKFMEFFMAAINLIQDRDYADLNMLTFQFIAEVNNEIKACGETLPVTDHQLYLAIEENIKNSGIALKFNTRILANKLFPHLAFYIQNRDWEGLGAHILGLQPEESNEYKGDGPRGRGFRPGGGTADESS